MQNIVQHFTWKGRHEMRYYVKKAPQQPSTVQPTTTRMMHFPARAPAKRKGLRYRLKRQHLSKTKMERRLQKGKTKERTQAKKDENKGKRI